MGTAMLYTVAIVFGGDYAMIAGAIGSGLFDLIQGFSAYTLWSFFIKGIAGYVVGRISHANGKNGDNAAMNILACIVGAAWTLAGYIVAWSFVIGDYRVALANTPSSLISSLVGMAVALPLSLAIKRTLKVSNIEIPKK